jgi:hypothetical protein
MKYASQIYLELVQSLSPIPLGKHADTAAL